MATLLVSLNATAQVPRTVIAELFTSTG